MSIPRMRTIMAAAQYFRERDPGTEIGPYFIRELIKNGKLKTVRAGNKYLLDLDCLEAYLAEGSIVEETSDTVLPFKGIRRVQA